MTTAWSEWKPWDATTALWPPPEIQPGVHYQADLAIRVEWIGKLPADYPWGPFIEGFEGIVVTGEAWVMAPAWCMPETTHLVTRYRVAVEETPIINEMETTA
jgi:hypothetical protein